MTDLGNVISDGDGHVGFPGFDGMTAPVARLRRDMLEHGVPVDLHLHLRRARRHSPATARTAPVSRLRAATRRVQQGLRRVLRQPRAHGIDPRNTLFVVTADEGDHFVGGSRRARPTATGSPSRATTRHGSGKRRRSARSTPTSGDRTRDPRQRGGSRRPSSLTSTPPPRSTSMATPGRRAAVTRKFERAVGDLTRSTRYSGATDQITQRPGQPGRAEHPAHGHGGPAPHAHVRRLSRTPTTTSHRHVELQPPPCCDLPEVRLEPRRRPAGDNDDMARAGRTWRGAQRRDTTTWTDHTDIRPTMMALLGLQDDYTYDGHVIAQALNNNALPSTLHNPSQLNAFESVAAMYDQINAPTGQFATSSLTISTHALESNTAGDGTYTYFEGQLTSMATQRNTIASQMNAILQSAALGNSKSIDYTHAYSLIAQGQSLLTQASTIAALQA